MITLLTYFNVADNSGANEAQCIKILGQTKNKQASVGMLVILSIKSLKTRTKSRVKKGEVVLGLIVRTKQPIYRTNGSVVNFNDNAVVLLNKKYDPIGTRVMGPISRECKTEKFLKLNSLAKDII